MSSWLYKQYTCRDLTVNTAVDGIEHYIIWGFKFQNVMHADIVQAIQGSYGQTI